jgi:hypothetical protein
MLSVVAPYSGGLRSWKELAFVEREEGSSALFTDILVCSRAVNLIKPFLSK